MPDLIQSIKTKIEFVMVSLALLGVVGTGAFVYSKHTSQLETHEQKILAIETRGDNRDTEAQAMASVIEATVIPAINSHSKDLLNHKTRLETMEKNARADREILIEIRNDLKWMRDRIDKP